MIREIIKMGNPLLRYRSDEVVEFSTNENNKNIQDVIENLEDFRKQNGFGRGIAAIQIGISKRIIGLNLGKGPYVIINPKIIKRSLETFEIWDDCMSFPDIVVKVQRNKSIDIEYQDENGKKHQWENLCEAESELLQHEIDHLDGILAIDRAVDKKSIIYKTEYNQNKDFYLISEKKF